MNVNKHYPSRHKCIVHWQVYNTGYQFIVVIHAAALSSRRLHGDPGDQQTPSTMEQQCDNFMKWTRCHRFRWCVKLCVEVWSAVLGGRSLCFVASVFSLHEQRTGWSSRLGTERRWRAGGLFTIITRSRWRHVTDSGLGQWWCRLAISNTLYLESGYIIVVQQGTMEGGTSA